MVSWVSHRLPAVGLFDVFLVQLNRASSLLSFWLHVGRPAAPSQGSCNEELSFSLECPRLGKGRYTAVISKRGGHLLSICRFNPIITWIMLNVTLFDAVVLVSSAADPQGAQTADNGIITV